MSDNSGTMADHGPSQQYKIPLKLCQDSVIEHDLVTIRLNVEWREKGGDEPCLVISVTNKQPTNAHFQQRNQPSVLFNPVRHRHQYQEKLAPMHQQQYHHLPITDNYDPSNLPPANTVADHNDISAMTTTTTVFYNSAQPQCQPSAQLAAIQKIESELKAGLHPSPSCQSPMSSLYLSSQHVIQAPSNDPDDSWLDTRPPASTSASSMKHMSSMITPYLEMQQPLMTTCSPSVSNNPQPRSLVCTCLNPKNYHPPDCGIFSSNNSDSSLNFLLEPVHRPPMSQANFSRVPSASQAHLYDAFFTSPLKEPMNTSLMPFPNPDVMRAFDPPSSVTTIVSQSPAMLNYASGGPTTRLSPMNHYQQPLDDFSQVILNNPYRCQIDSRMPMPILGQQKLGSKPPRQRKKSVKRSAPINQDQTSSQSLTNLSPIQAINNLNSPIGQQIITPPSLLLSPVLTLPEIFAFPDIPEFDDHFLSGITDDSQTTPVQQSSSPTNSFVRSPVNLGACASKNANTMTISSEDVDRTISDVLQGKGSISTRSLSTESVSRQENKPSVISHIVWESNGPVTTTRTFASPLKQEQSPFTEDSNTSALMHQNVDHITEQGAPSNSTEQNQMNTLSPTNNPEKRRLSNSTTRPKSKRLSKPNTKIQPETPKSISYRETLPMGSISSITTQPIPWIDTPIPSSSPKGATITSTEHLDQNLMGNSLEIVDINHNNDIVKRATPSIEQPRIIYPNDPPHGFELDDIFSLRANERFDSSSPSPSSPPPSSATVLIPSSTTSQVLHPVPLERTSDRSAAPKTNTVDIYDYFVPNLSSSSSIWEGHPAVATFIPSSDPSNSSHSAQQSYSQIDTYFDTDEQSQTHPSPFPELYSNQTDSMNANDDVPTSLQQQTNTSSEVNQRSKPVKTQPSKHPSKLSKQQSRANPIKKKSPSKPRCTRCGLTQLIDITRHEFPKQKGVVFECASCGNSSIQSDVSADERKRRLAKVAADHLNKVECQFCHKLCHSHNEYISHLRDDHNSNKPI